VVTPAYTGRREIFAALQYRPEFTLTADFDFLARAAERFTLAAVPEVLLEYRHHPGQTTVQQSARISAERCVVRLVAARRRAGRPEGDDWRHWLREAAAGIETEAAVLRRFAQRCLNEDFWVLAAYHARRSVAAERSVPALVAALGWFVRAWWRADGERGLVTRMFFRGPVKALGVKLG